MSIVTIWVLESNGIHPQNPPIKNKVVTEIKSKDDVKTDDNGGMSDNLKKAVNLINLMKQYKELALTVRKVVHFFRCQAKVE